MKCVACGHDVLYGKVTIEKLIVVNHKGGNLNMKGQKISQSDVKDAWTKDKFRKDKEIFGPIICEDCGAHHVYLPGETPALRLGRYEEVVEMGREAFLEEEEEEEGND